MHSISNAAKSEPTPRTNPWVIPHRNGADAPLRLFCFAHAGGGPTFFRAWCEPLLPELEVCRLSLPGRESRRREAPFTRLDQLIEPIFDALQEYTDKPFAFFGHSMGAVLAYEVARRFQARGVPGPVHLLISGRRAPHLPARRRPFYNLPNEEFIAVLRGMNGTPVSVLQKEDLLDVFLPCLRADFEAIETYVQLPGERLACPVSAFTGDADPEVEWNELSAWKHVTTGPFRSRVFSGDHFYLQGARLDLLSAIRDELKPAISAAQARGGVARRD